LARKDTLGFGLGQCNSTIGIAVDWFCTRAGFGRGRKIERDHIRAEAAADLLGQGIVIGRKNSAIECVPEARNPLVVEMVKNACIDARPVMNRHND